MGIDRVERAVPRSLVEGDLARKQLDGQATRNVKRDSPYETN
jgi:hypothetical protein